MRHTTSRWTGPLFAVLILNACASEADRWAETEHSSSAAAFEAFLAEFPESEHAADARMQLEELDWLAADSADAEAPVEAYLSKHPQGVHVEMAKARMELLKKTALHRAVKRGALAEVNAMVKIGADVNDVRATGASPLHIAAAECHEELARLLIAHGANVSQAAADRSTPLHWAARAGCIAVMRQLLDAGAEVDAEVSRGLMGFSIGEQNTVDYFGYFGSLVPGTPLHWACKHGQSEAAELLLESGADPMFLADGDLTPMHRAAAGGKVEVAELLLRHGGKVHLDETDDAQPIHYSKNKEMLYFFQQHGEDMNGSSRYSGKPLHMAVFLHHSDAVAHLLASGANANEIGEWNLHYGWTADVTPAWIAAYVGDTALLRMLQKAGADLRYEYPNYGGSLMHAAASQGHAHMVRLLAAHGLPIDAKATVPTAFAMFQPWRGITPLAIAAHFGEVDAADACIDAGADVNAVFQDDWTPLTLAMVAKRIEMVSFLLEHGAVPRFGASDVDTRNTSDTIKAVLRSYFASHQKKP